MGNGRRLKEANPETLIVAAEPMQGELVQGLRSLDDGFIPPIIDLSLLDRKIMVSNRDAIVWTKKLLDEEGVFAGVSAGAIAAIADRIAGELDERQRRLPGPRRRLEVPLLRRLHEADRGDREPRLHRLVVGASLLAADADLPEPCRRDGRARARGSAERVLRDGRRQGRRGDHGGPGRELGRQPAALRDGPAGRSSTR